MYPYHNRIRQRINNGELIGIERTEGRFRIVLIFKTFPYKRPIREHALWRYVDIIKKYKISL